MKLVETKMAASWEYEDTDKIHLFPLDNSPEKCSSMDSIAQTYESLHPDVMKGNMKFLFDAKRRRILNSLPLLLSFSFIDDIEGSPYGKWCYFRHDLRHVVAEVFTSDHESLGFAYTPKEFAKTILDHLKAFPERYQAQINAINQRHKKGMNGDRLDRLYKNNM